MTVEVVREASGPLLGFRPETMGEMLALQDAEIVVLARLDGLYDILKHPRGMLKRGLCKRERDGFVLPNARVVEIREREER